MHRRPQTAGLSAVMLSLLVVMLSPAVALGRGHAGPRHYPPIHTVTPDAAELARTAPQAIKHGTTNQRCTGWRSTLTPPPTINVLRTKGPAVEAVGHPVVETVDFRTYALTVFGAEWPRFYPSATLKVGAIAVKQYGWYYTIVYRGGLDADGVCYDVQDDTTDQYYQPQLRKPAPIHVRTLDATWNITLRKYQRSEARSRFFLTGYRQGSASKCGVDADRFRVYQHSAFACGRAGMTMEQILRTYLDPNLEIVDPGSHDIVASNYGDPAALIADGDGGLVPRIWPTGGATLGPAGPGGPVLGADSLIGVASTDLTADGHDDLLIASSTGDTSIRLSIAISDGAAYGDPISWYEGDLGAPVAGAQLLSGDFTGDGRPDAALLLPGAEPGSVTLSVFAGKKGSGFLAPVPWWSASLDLATTRVWAADLNGDGRTDLLVRSELPEGGLAYLSAASLPGGGGLDALQLRYVGADLVADRTLQVIADANRDGRDDVWLVVGGPGVRTHVDLLLTARGNRKSVRTTAYTATKADPLPISKLRAAGADMDANGMGDLVLYRDLPEADKNPATDVGTRIIALEAGDARTTTATPYGRLVVAITTDDLALDWSTLRPY